MSDEKLEDLKVTSSVLFVISLIGTIIVAASEIDSMTSGGVSLIWLVVIAFLATVASLAVAIVSSHILKKRQGESYFSLGMFMQALVEFLFPARASSDSVRLKKLNLSDRNKQTRLWRELCVGYDKKGILYVICWFALFAGCVGTAALKVLDPDASNRILDVVSLSIAAVVVLVIMIVVAMGIKKDPTPIFEYMDMSKTRFYEIAKHFDQAEKLADGIWADRDYIFATSGGKAYCIPVREYEGAEILFSRFRFVMVLNSTYHCVVKSALLPVGFYKARARMEEWCNKSKSVMNSK